MTSRSLGLVFWVGVLISGTSNSVQLHRNPWLDCSLEPLRQVQLSFPVSGVVAAISVARGEPVSVGQELARLESSVEQATVEQASIEASTEGKILARQASLRFATRYLERVRDLYSDNSISITDKEQAETDLILAHMELKQAEESKRVAQRKLLRAKAILSKRSIRSPIAGVVTRRYASVGEFVKDKPIISVAQLDPLKIEVEAPAVMFGKISKGMLADVEPAEPLEGSYSAEVSAVDPLLDRDAGTFGVQLRLPNGDHRLPGGLACRVRFQLAEFMPRSADKPAEPATPAVSREPESVGKSAFHAASVKPVIQPAVSEQKSAGVKSLNAIVDTQPLDCVVLGPFALDRHVNQVRSGLQGKKYQLQVRRYKEIESDGFSVFAPKQSSAAMQKALLARLEEIQITDFLVLKSGRYTGRVALGHFEQRSRAEIHKNMLDSHGIDSQIEARFRSRYGRWLEVRPVPSAEEISSISQELAAQWPGLKLDLNACAQNREFRGKPNLVGK